MTSSEQSTPEPQTPTALADLSTDFLTAVRTGESTPPLERELAGLDRDALRGLSTDREAATAFWINLYNAFTQLLLERDRSLYDSRGRFFSSRLIPIAGDRFSLDEIEHGILRGGHWKLGGGYLRWPFYRDVVDQLALDPADRDWRIHFALNCGAASCPPIVAYTASDVDHQLDVATRSYLDSEVRYDVDRNVARVPRLCLWYRGDFGGRRGIQQLLAEFEQVPPEARPRLRYADYDWSLDLDQFPN
jgi:hypothetical protein